MLATGLLAGVAGGLYAAIVVAIQSWRNSRRDNAPSMKLCEYGPKNEKCGKEGGYKVVSIGYGDDCFLDVQRLEPGDSAMPHCSGHAIIATEHPLHESPSDLKWDN